jgi:hypothetical protein
MLLVLGLLVAPLSTMPTKAFGVSDIINGSNQARQQLNKSPLTASADLMSAAQMKAEDMAKGHFFAHTAPDGTVAWDYFKKVGYSYSVAGENLALTNQGSDDVIQGWLNSPTHRANLLSADYSDMGIGMASFGDYQGHKNTYVIVAFYGKRASKQSPIAATSPAGGTTSLKTSLLPISPAIVISASVVLMVVGITLEVRHIRKLHHAKHLA